MAFIYKAGTVLLISVLSAITLQTVISAPADIDLLEDVLRDLLRSEVQQRSNDDITGSRSQRSQVDPAEALGNTLLSNRKLQGAPLRICAFNIRMFGERKYANVAVRKILIKILGRYDITLVQEIRDADPPDSFIHLMADMRKEYGTQMAYVISRRLGRSNSKEQYAYIYNSNRVSVRATYTYPDPNDDFERPPYTVIFQSTSTAVEEFGIIGVHTKPSKAEDEIDHLVDVYEAVKTKYNVENIILMGDFNADCSYVTGGEWSKVRLRTDPSFTWLIGDGIDTTVAGTHCAYDRFVIHGAQMEQAVVPKSAVPFRFDTFYGLNKTMTEAVSDHYPIEMELYGSVSARVLDSHVEQSFTVVSTEVATGDIMRMLTKDRRTYRYFAYFTPTIVTSGDDSWVQLKRSETCTEVITRLARLRKQRPELLSDVVLGLAESYMATILDSPRPKVPGLIVPAPPRSGICEIVIRYDGFNYKVTVSKQIQ